MCLLGPAVCQGLSLGAGPGGRQFNCKLQCKLPPLWLLLRLTLIRLHWADARQVLRAQGALPPVTGLQLHDRQLCCTLPMYARPKGVKLCLHALLGEPAAQTCHDQARHCELQETSRECISVYADIPSHMKMVGIARLWTAVSCNCSASTVRLNLAQPGPSGQQVLHSVNVIRQEFIDRLSTAFKQKLRVKIADAAAVAAAAAAFDANCTRTCNHQRYHSYLNKHCCRPLTSYIA